jgi:galactokinase/mevalonate kinase-like predicted kinase
MAKLDFAGMQAIMPEVVNLEEDYISNKLQTEIEKSTRKAQEIWDNMWEDIKVEDAKRATERKAAHEERMRAQQEFTSQPSGSTSGSSGSSGSAPMHSRCVKKGSQPASYQLCKMSGGNASGSTCCFK